MIRQQKEVNAVSPLFVVKYPVADFPNHPSHNSFLAVACAVASLALAHCSGFWAQ